MNKKLSLYSLVLLFPLVSFAQPTNELNLVEQAIKNYMRQTTSAEVHVENIRIEGALSTAEVTAKGSESAMVCLKKSNDKWVVVNMGSGFGPGDCE